MYMEARLNGSRMGGVRSKAGRNVPRKRRRSLEAGVGAVRESLETPACIYLVSLYYRIIVVYIHYDFSHHAQCSVLGSCSLRSCVDLWSWTHGECTMAMQCRSGGWICHQQGGCAQSHCPISSSLFDRQCGSYACPASARLRHAKIHAAVQLHWPLLPVTGDRSPLFSQGPNPGAVHTTSLSSLHSLQGKAIIVSRPRYTDMSPFHSVDRAALDEISLLCGVDLGQIEDVYDCTPFQLGIAADPAYFQRFVLSISTDMDTASLSDAMNEVVALNQILRTRIVDSQRLGLVQVVLRDDPATCTQRIKTGLDQYIEEQRSASTNLAAPLFRSTIIQDARKLVITIHHSVFDHSSLVSLIDDVTKIYHKEKPSFRAPFKQFVDYCGSVRHSEAKDFWTQQFVGIPGIFPSVPINCKIDASSRTSRRIRTPAGLASPALLPVYLECAWAILAHAYGGGESVAYGVVYSGRNASAAWKGMESTLGPTIATLPVEVAIDLEDTIGEFLKSRQLGRQAVQGCGAAMQLGLNNIRKVSESAKRASDFQTVLNFLHGPPPIPGGSPIKFDYEDDIHKAYAICLTFSIDPSANTSSQGQAGKFEVLADFDESLMSMTAMNRLLVQLEHILQSLTRAANHMRIGQLALLSSTDRLDLLKSNNSIAEPVNASLHAMVRKMAIAHPDDAAVDAWDGRLTYSELVTMADNLVSLVHW